MWEPRPFHPSTQAYFFDQEVNPGETHDDEEVLLVSDVHLVSSGEANSKPIRTVFVAVLQMILIVSDKYKSINTFPAGNNSYMVLISKIIFEMNQMMNIGARMKRMSS